MLEEKGHQWRTGLGSARCIHCQMRYSYYLEIKRASRQQPERDDLTAWMKCDGSTRLEAHSTEA